jgi:hypothetical protein
MTVWSPLSIADRFERRNCFLVRVKVRKPVWFNVKRLG